MYIRKPAQPDEVRNPGPRQFVGTFVFGTAIMAFDPVPVGLMARDGEMANARIFAANAGTGYTARMNIHMPQPIPYERIKSGLAATDVSRFVKSGKLTWDDVYAVIPERTFKRRMAARRPLRLSESDAIARLLHIEEMSTWAFQTKARARIFLATPNLALGNHVPWDMARSEAGAREVEALLVRFVHGVYA